jgi:hypothetical protein
MPLRGQQGKRSPTHAWREALEAAIVSHQAVSDRLGVVEADAICRVVNHTVEGGGSPSHQLVRLRDALRGEYGDGLEYEGTSAAE